MIYLDNSATSYPKPPSVANAVFRSIVDGYANPGRSGHKYSIKASQAIEETRYNVSQLIKCNCENVIFTHNCTDSLSCSILGYLKHGDHVITSIFEHNSVLRPLQHLKNMGKISYDCANPNEDGIITANCIEKLKKRNTSMVVLSHVSNVCGAVSDIRGIYDYCKKNNLVLCLDAAQSAGNINIDSSMADIICMPSHKGFLGPMGCGIMYISPGIELTPIRFGGTGSESESLSQPKFRPDKFESGTLPVTAIMGLNAGVNQIKDDIDKIHTKEISLAKNLVERLRKVPGVKVYNNASDSGVVLFNISNYDSRIVSNILDRDYDIATRPGFHCAPLIHKYFNTLDQGGVRASIGYYNTQQDIDCLIDAIKDIIDKDKLKAELC